MMVNRVFYTIVIFKVSQIHSENINNKCFISHAIFEIDEGKIHL